MVFFREGVPPLRLVLAIAAVVIVVIAALTTWGVLLALIPLAMVIGCMTMMATTVRRMDGAPRAVRRACCGERHARHR